VGTVSLKVRPEVFDEPFIAEKKKNVLLVPLRLWESTATEGSTEIGLRRFLGRYFPPRSVAGEREPGVQIFVDEVS